MKNTYYERGYRFSRDCLIESVLYSAGDVEISEETAGRLADDITAEVNNLMAGRAVWYPYDSILEIEEGVEIDFHEIESIAYQNVFDEKGY